jgi:hypothetical protein
MKLTKHTLQALIKQQLRSVLLKENINQALADLRNLGYELQDLIDDAEDDAQSESPQASATYHKYKIDSKTNDFNQVLRGIHNPHDLQMAINFAKSYGFKEEDLAYQLHTNSRIGVALNQLETFKRKNPQNTKSYIKAVNRQILLGLQEIGEGNDVSHRAFKANPALAEYIRNFAIQNGYAIRFRREDAPNNTIAAAVAELRQSGDLKEPTWQTSLAVPMAEFLEKTNLNEEEFLLWYDIYDAIHRRQGARQLYEYNFDFRIEIGWGPLYDYMRDLEDGLTRGSGFTAPPVTIHWNADSQGANT